VYQGLTVFCHGFCQASCKYIKVYFTDCMCKRKLLGIVWVSTKWVKFVRYLKTNKQTNKGNTMWQCIEFKEAHDSVRWEVLHNILSEFGIPVKW